MDEKKQNEFVIGVDVGRANTGIIIFNITKKEIIFNGTMSLPAQMMRDSFDYNWEINRLALIDTLFGSLLDRHIVDGKALGVVEDYAYADVGVSPQDLKNMDRDALQLSEVHGIFYMNMAKRKIPVVKIYPTSLKYFITGDGRAEKTDMIKFLHKIYESKLDDIELKDDHQYDALGLVHFGRNYLAFCKKPSCIQEGTIAYNTVIKVAYDPRYIMVSKHLGLKI